MGAAISSCMHSNLHGGPRYDLNASWSDISIAPCALAAFPGRGGAAWTQCPPFANFYIRLLLGGSSSGQARRVKGVGTFGREGCKVKGFPGKLSGFLPLHHLPFLLLFSFGWRRAGGMDHGLADRTDVRWTTHKQTRPTFEQQSSQFLCSYDCPSLLFARTSRFLELHSCIYADLSIYACI